MICNIACPAMVSKVLKALKTAKLMNGTQSSLWLNFITHSRQNTRSSSDICKVHLSVLNTCALMPVLQRIAFRMVCKLCLEGRGNNDLWNVQDFEPHFRMDRADTNFLKLLLLSSGLCLLFPTICQKSWSLYILKRWKGLYHRITVQLTTSFRFFVMYKESNLNVRGDSTKQWIHMFLYFM
jgi:hypothetical protein